MEDIYRKIIEIQKLQSEVDRRTRVEREAETLICQCRFSEAVELLAILD